MPARISFPPLSLADLPLLHRWLAEPHIETWWHEALDMEAVHAKYLPRIAGIEPTYVHLIELDGRPVGWIQWYRWSDYPEQAARIGADLSTAGVDLALGEADQLGRGLGSRALTTFVEQVVFDDPAISACVTDPDERNLRSLRAFEKAGFSVVRSVRLAGDEANRCVVRRNRAAPPGP